MVRANSNMKTILDLCCGAGGGSAGYAAARFKVIGIDINPQPNYPYEFIQMDALEAGTWGMLDQVDAVHASPPCQNYCWSTSKPRSEGKTYPDLIAPIRNMLIKTGKPYVIENVPNSPLQNPTYLEGTMFGLGVIRRRYFETNFWLPQPMYIKHKPPIWQPGKIDPRIHLKKSAYCSVAGNGADGWSCRIADWREAMGINWMNRKEITQAIPPAYTRYIGQYLHGIL